MFARFYSSLESITLIGIIEQRLFRECVDLELNSHLIFHLDGSACYAHRLNAEVLLFDARITRIGVARLLDGHYYGLANTCKGSFPVILQTRSRPERRQKIEIG